MSVFPDMHPIKILWVHFLTYSATVTMFRNVCFTDFDVSEERKKALLSLDAKYMVFQLEECPDSGKYHFQGYCELNKRMRIFGGAPHFEKRRGTAAEADAYCRKKDSQVDGPWFFGQMKKPGSRNDLDEVKVMIDEGASEEAVADAYFGQWCRYRKSFKAYKRMKYTPGDTPKEVSVFWGDAGTGKTRRVYDKEGYEVFSKPDGQWFDGYDGQEAVLFDDFTGDLPLGQFLQLLDRYPMKVPVKGDFVQWIPKRLYITSNLSPEEWYPKATATQHKAIRRRIGLIEHYSSGPLPTACAGFVSPTQKPVLILDSDCDSQDDQIAYNLE